jgi:hypothetical protein
MSEKKWRRLFFGLIIGSEIEPDLVTGFKMACIRHDRNPIAYFLADRYSLKRLTGNYGSTRLTRGSVDFPQARTQVSSREVNCFAGLPARSDALGLSWRYRKSPANSRAQTFAKSSVARTSSWVTRLKGAAARVKAAAMRAEWYSAS